MPIQEKLGPGWAVLNGDTKQRMTKEPATRASAGAHFLLVTLLCASKEKQLARGGETPT
jgi:hypothetical protein